MATKVKIVSLIYVGTRICNKAAIPLRTAINPCSPPHFRIWSSYYLHDIGECCCIGRGKAVLQLVLAIPPLGVSTLIPFLHGAASPRLPPPGSPTSPRRGNTYLGSIPNYFKSLSRSMISKGLCLYRRLLQLRYGVTLTLVCFHFMRIINPQLLATATGH